MVVDIGQDCWNMIMVFKQQMEDIENIQKIQKKMKKLKVEYSNILKLIFETEYAYNYIKQINILEKQIKINDDKQKQLINQLYSIYIRRKKLTIMYLKIK